MCFESESPMVRNGGSAPTLEDLARARFGALTAAEVTLVQRTPAEEIAECSVSRNPNDPADPANDPANAGSWDPAQSVRPDLIRWLCTDVQARANLAPKGIRIRTAVIRERLDLSFASIPVPLQFLNCGFLKEVDFSGASIRALTLTGSEALEIRADALTVEMNFILDRGFRASEVRLVGAEIGGELRCSGGLFVGRQGGALTADNAVVKGDVLFNGGFVACGEVRLPGAEIGGQLNCSGGRFLNRRGDALSADGAVVHGDVFLDAGFASHGQVRLPGAEIRGQVYCSGGRFLNRQKNALSADRAVIKGSVFLDEGFRTDGVARMVGAEIGGQLSCVGGRFLNRNGSALVASGAVINSHVFLDGFRAYGEVRLSGAEILGQLSCRGGRLLNRKGHALAASRAVIKGHVFLDGGFRAYGDVRLLGAEIRGGLNMTIGYGYEPLRALCWIVGFVIFGLSYRGGLLAPSDSNGSGPFCAAVYSVNTFVPLIDLGQRDHWIPRSAPAAHPADSWAGPLGRLLCDAAIVDVLPRSWMPSATFLSFFRWSYILFGWFFTTIFVAGVTGLVRR